MKERSLAKVRYIFHDGILSILFLEVGFAIELCLHRGRRAVLSGIRKTGTILFPKGMSGIYLPESVDIYVRNSRFEFPCPVLVLLTKFLGCF